MDFIIAKHNYRLTKESVEKALRGRPPEDTQKYGVLINGKEYPPKQVLGVALDLGRSEFTTMYAIGILRRLGFDIKHYD